MVMSFLLSFLFLINTLCTATAQWMAIKFIPEVCS